jgi:hypothetical protein
MDMVISLMSLFVPFFPINNHVVDAHFWETKDIPRVEQIPMPKNYAAVQTIMKPQVEPMPALVQPAVVSPVVAVPVFTFSPVPPFPPYSVVAPSIPYSNSNIGTGTLRRHGLIRHHFSFASLPPAPVVAASLPPASVVQKPIDEAVTLETRQEMNRKWATEQLQLLKDKTTEYFNQGREFVAAHPYETATWVLAALFVLTLAHYRRRIRRLKFALELSTCAYKSAEALAKEVVHGNPTSSPLSSNDTNDNTMIHDMVAAVRNAHEIASRQTVTAFTHAMNHAQESTAEVLNQLKAAHTSLVTALQQTQNVALTEIRNAANKTVDTTTAAANNALNAVAKAAGEAEIKVVEVMKLALDVLKSSQLEHSKSEAATVAALAQTAQKAVDSTSVVLDCLAEDDDQ